MGASWETSVLSLISLSCDAGCGESLITRRWDSKQDPEQLGVHSGEAA